MLGYDNGVYQNLVNVLEQYGVHPKSVTVHASITKDLCLDSLDFVELIMEMEVAADVSIPMERAEQVDSVMDLVKLVELLQTEQHELA